MKLRSACMASLLLFSIMLLSLIALKVAASPANEPGDKVYGDRVVVAKVVGTIDGAVEDYIRSAIKYSERNNAILILMLDTPGGWVSNALEIVGLLETSRVPVVGFVYGKWAMSAGTLILMCSHIAAMRPGAIIGAVQPVAFNPATGSYTPVNESKIVNPIVGKLAACVKLRLSSLGANSSVIDEAVKQATLMVKENKVFEAEDALKHHVVDFVARDIEDLLIKINNTVVERPEASYAIRVPENPQIDYYKMGIGLHIAHFLSDPVISGLLSSIGILIILASLFTGHVYAIALGVALILLSLLGMGYSAGIIGLVMVIVGLVLLIVELTMIPGFGIIGATGIGLLVLGLIMLPTGAGPVNISAEYLQRVTMIVTAVSAPLAGIMGVIIYKAVRIWRKKPVYEPTIIGKTGKAVDDIPPGGEGFIIIEGEYWRAKSSKGVKKGCRVKVVGKEGPVLIVEPLEEPC
ncbi:MAG: nodulation protein NfeD [Pyrodictiaceae archaeon]